MRDKGQGGAAAIWGAGCILVAFGMVLFLDSFTQSQLGFQALSFLESFIAVVLVLFGALSFYMAHK